MSRCRTKALKLSERNGWRNGLRETLQNSTRGSVSGDQQSEVQAYTEGYLVREQLGRKAHGGPDGQQPDY